MDFQDLTGQWIVDGQPIEPDTGIEFHSDEIVLYPPKTNVNFQIAPQKWPAHYTLDGTTLTVVFKGKEDTQTLTFDVLDAQSIQDNNGYIYKKCTSALAS